MQPGWIPEVFTTSELGVSSAYSPELIPQNQLAWGVNMRVRGGKVHPRQVLKERLLLPEGNVQGINFFSIQGGMLITSIGGRIYRIRINGDNFSWEEVTLDWRNSALRPNAWMQETVGNLVIQDGESAAIIYNGSVARRADPTKNEVPLGTAMAFGNGRLWVAINGSQLIAGDIRTSVFGSELLFTEATYFSGGGAFYFPFNITGLGFIAASGEAGYGSLMVFGTDETQTVRADIASRDLWPDYPGFIQPLLLHTGAISHFSISQVNQDLYWRDSQGGLRSLRSAEAQESQSFGNTPISREVSRITDYESVNRLTNCSSIFFENRFLMTASPFINKYGNTSYKNLLSLDFAPLSSNRTKVPPAYDGPWEALNFVRLVQGKFNGRRRAFVVSSGPNYLAVDSSTISFPNRLWEITEDTHGDIFHLCQGDGPQVSSRIVSNIELPRRDWGEPKRRKRLERCDVYLSNIKEVVNLSVYWRPDNYEKWIQWDQITNLFGSTTDSSNTTPHVWQNLAPQQIPQIMTFSIPSTENDPVTSRGLLVGFQHQIKVVIDGNAQVEKVVVYSSLIDEEQFAQRGYIGLGTDVTGNYTPYFLSLNTCDALMKFFVSNTETKPGYTIDCGNVPINNTNDITCSMDNFGGDTPVDITDISLSDVSLGITLPDLPSFPHTLDPSIGMSFTIRSNSSIAGRVTVNLTISAFRGYGTPYVFPVTCNFV